MLRFFKINLIEISSLKPQHLIAYNFLIKFQPPEEKKILKRKEILVLNHTLSSLIIYERQPYDVFFLYKTDFYRTTC